MVLSEDEPFFEFTWTISKFSLCRHNPDEFLDSPTFVVRFLQDTVWHLRIHPVETDPNLKDSTGGSTVDNSIACFLRRTQLGVPSIDVQYSLCLDDSNCEAQQVFRKGSASDKCVKVGRTRYFRKVAVGQRDKLTVSCRLRPTQRPAECNSVVRAPYPPVCCSAITTVPAERRKICWRIENFPDLPSQHEVTIPVVSASPDSPKLLVTLSWSDESSREKQGGHLVLEIREMPELVGKTFMLALDVHLVDAKSKRKRLERDWYRFKTVQKNYWLWVKTYSDSVWNLRLDVDRADLLDRRSRTLQQGALVLECDFTLSYEPVTSCVVSSGYVHPQPESKEVVGECRNDDWREMLLNNFNDQTSVFKFFFLLFVFLAVISRVFKNDE